MHQKEIVAAIKDLLPEIRKSGSAEDTLIKYARTKNLSPAQLEKVAQTYNIAKTVNFMEKSANRGASFPVVDVPNLLKKYASHTLVKRAGTSVGVIKSASAKVGEIDYNDINSWIDPVKKSANKSDAGVPNFNRELRDEDAGPLELAAKIEDTTFLDKMATSEAAIEARLLKDLEAGLQDDVREKMAFFREAFNRMSAPNFAHLGEDVLLLNPEAVPALEKVSFYLSDTGVKISHTDTTIEKLASAKLAKDRTGFLGHVVELQELYNDLEKLALYKVAGKTYRSLQQIGEDEGEVDANAHTPPSASERASKEEAERRAEAIAGAAAAKNIPTEKPKPPTDLGDQDTVPDQEALDRMTARDNNKEKDLLSSAIDAADYTEKDHTGAKLQQGIENNLPPPPTDPPQITRLSVDAKKDADPKKDADKAHKEKDTFNKLLQVPKHVVGQFKTLRSVIDSLASQKSNKGQQHMDEHLSTSKSMMHLQRLMVTDPIISEADPDMVVSLFNTLKGANGDIVQDPNMLRFALREAIQYESVPPHTYKDLTEIGLKGTQAQNEKQKFDDKHYSIGSPSRVDYKSKSDS